MTQAEGLQALLQRWHRTQTQPGRTADDRAEALATIQCQLREAEQTLRLPIPPGGDQDHRQLILWAEMAKGTLKEAGVEAHL